MHMQRMEEGMGKQVAEDRTPPIYLGPKQLAELENLQIIDKGASQCSCLSGWKH